MILVTGAAGTVGTEVVRALKAKGVPFRAAHRSRPIKVEGVESVAVDYGREETVQAALEGIDTLFLLSNDVASEAGVVIAAQRSGVRRIVTLSVIDAEKEAFTFARWHRAVEKQIEASGVAWTFLRPAGFMQNIINYMGPTIRSESRIYQNAGDGKVSHVDARDIGEVAALALTEPGHERKAYTLTGPRAVSYGEIAELLSSALGRAITYVALSDEQLKQGAVASGTPPAYADALVELGQFYRSNALAFVSPDIEKVTGHAPRAIEPFVSEHAGELKPL